VLSDRLDNYCADRPDRHDDFSHDKTTASYLRIVRAASDGVLVFYRTEEGGGPLAGFAVTRPVELVPHLEVLSWNRILVADAMSLTSLVPIRPRTGSYLGVRQGDLVKSVRGLSGAGSG